MAAIDRLIDGRLGELAAEGQRLQAEADAGWLAQVRAAESERRVEAGRPTARQLAEQQARTAQIEVQNAEHERVLAGRGELALPTPGEMRARVLAQRLANQPQVAVTGVAAFRQGRFG